MEENKNPYAGRWVAKLKGRIVAQGGTPQQALLASQATRHKEKPEIIFMPIHFSLPPLIQKIKDILPAGQEIYLVGGAVRDLFLSRLSSDFDFALPSGGISLARKIANAFKADFVPLDDERDTGRVIIHENESRIFLDFATYRGKDPSTSSGQALEEDLRARDFTINAIAYNLQDDTLIDPTEGVKDIESKVIRACSPTSFTDDPIRILRAVRLAATFDFSIDKRTREWMSQAHPLIRSISVERIRDEIFKILNSKRVSDSIKALDMLGVIEQLMPELLKMKGVEQSSPHVFEVWTHTLSVLDYLEKILFNLFEEIPKNEFAEALQTQLGKFREQIHHHFSQSLNIDRTHRSLLFFAALYHDVCKPDTKTIDENGRIRFFNHDVQGADVVAERARSFNLSNDEVERLSVIIKNHMRIHSFTSKLENENEYPTRRAIYRFFRDAGKAGIDLILLALADMRGTRDKEMTLASWNIYLEISRILLENYFEKPQETVSPPRLLDGNDLIKELNLQPSKLLGELLEAIRENQAEGNIQTREEALTFAKEELKKLQQ
ncbi:MAG: HD domain-containing protein [Anaerolineales bacterium]|nr:HD domain-containing protein [Anaerolineales bacterium]MBX3035358.1 HD domain-containing protein [Anaerolineales bacterium]